MKKTQEFFVHWTKHGEFDLRSYDASRFDPDLVLISKQSIEIQVPDDFNPTPKLIENLEAMKAELNRQFAQKVAEINEQISKLQCLTYEVTT